MQIYQDLIKNDKKFRMFTGTTIQEFDFLYARVAKKYPGMEAERLSRPGRRRAAGAGRPHALCLRDRLALCLFYIRTYATQQIAAMFFKIAQSTVSDTIKNMSPVLEECLPTPKKIYARARKITTMEDLMEMFPCMACMTDASEQPIQRPRRRDMERSHYSGKAGTHTSKVRHAMSVRGPMVQGRAPAGARERHHDLPEEAPAAARDPACGRRGRREAAQLP